MISIHRSKSTAVATTKPGRKHKRKTSTATDSAPAPKQHKRNDLHDGRRNAMNDDAFAGNQCAPAENEGGDKENQSSSGRNIILHLANCFLADLETHPKTPSALATLDAPTTTTGAGGRKDTNDVRTHVITPAATNIKTNRLKSMRGNLSPHASKRMQRSDNDVDDDTCAVDGSECSQTDISAVHTAVMSDIWKKVRALQTSLHQSSVYNPMSACFWCTCQFTSPPFYIPKHKLHSEYYVYGHFCTPECACAYLNVENIDNATKVERHQMLCGLYSEAFADNSWIDFNAAPQPHYVLSKFFGTLDDSEFQAIIQNSRVFLSSAVPPLTRIIPELHDHANVTVTGIGKQVIPEWSNKNVIDGCNQLEKNAALKRFGLKRDRGKNDILHHI